MPEGLHLTPVTQHTHPYFLIRELRNPGSLVQRELASVVAVSQIPQVACDCLRRIENTAGGNPMTEGLHPRPPGRS